jgi:hypothetical protein
MGIIAERLFKYKNIERSERHEFQKAIGKYVPYTILPDLYQPQADFIITGIPKVKNSTNDDKTQIRKFLCDLFPELELDKHPLKND